MTDSLENKNARDKNKLRRRLTKKSGAEKNTSKTALKLKKANSTRKLPASSGWPVCTLSHYYSQVLTLVAFDGKKAAG